MSESMVERVARAIYEDRNGPRCTSWSLRPKLHQQPYLDDARAALKALREPTEAVLEAGPPEPYMDTDVWRSMIDAALSEPQP